MKTTDHPLISLTEQEIFNKAYYGIQRQNESEYVDEAYYSDDSYYLDEAYLENRPDCVLNIVCLGYRAPSEWLTPEVDTFWKLLDIDPSTVDPERKTFLALLRLTDHADIEDDLMDPLRQFAHKRGLTVPPDLD
jgi:hypothetical protein